jgi:hypothetical protein
MTFLTATKSTNTDIIFNIGESEESNEIKKLVKLAQPFSDCPLSQLSYLLQSRYDISEFEYRAEYLRGLLLEDLTFLSEKEMEMLKLILENNEDILKSSLNKSEFILLSLISLLEPLFEKTAYFNEVESIVLVLLKSSCSSLRYAALEVISFGLGGSSKVIFTLESAKELLRNEPCEYVRNYLETF